MSVCDVLAWGAGWLLISVSGRVWQPGCRAGWAGFHRPGCPPSWPSGCSGWSAGRESWQPGSCGSDVGGPGQRSAAVRAPARHWRRCPWARLLVSFTGLPRPAQLRTRTLPPPGTTTAPRMSQPSL